MSLLKKLIGKAEDFVLKRLIKRVLETKPQLIKDKSEEYIEDIVTKASQRVKEGLLKLVDTAINEAVKKLNSVITNKKK